MFARKYTYNRCTQNGEGRHHLTVVIGGWRWNLGSLFISFYCNRYYLCSQVYKNSVYVQYKHRGTIPKFVSELSG